VTKENPSHHAWCLGWSYYGSAQCRQNSKLCQWVC
jgi:hypothetical protein